MTREHIFPKWLNQFFPESDTTNHTFGTIEESAIWGVPNVVESRRPGHMVRNTIKIVCRKCNNGWMSALEGRVKPFLIPLISFERLNVTPEVQKELAVWASKTAIVAERIRERDNGITQSERDYLKTELCPPPNWSVWFAGYTGGVWSELGLAQDRGNVSVSPLGTTEDIVSYVQATTFGMGYSAFLVVATGWESGSKVFHKFEREGLFRIWPPYPRSIIWPPPILLEDTDVNDLSNILRCPDILNQSANPMGSWKFKM